MNRSTTRRQALKTLAATGLGGALAAPALARSELQKALAFSSRRDLASSF